MTAIAFNATAHRHSHFTVVYSQVLKRKVLDVGMVDRIFLRANMDRSNGKEELYRKDSPSLTHGSKSKVKRVDNKDNELVLHEFGAAMIRLAHARYRGVASIAGRFSKLLVDNVKPYAVQDAIDDAFAEKLHLPKVEAVLATHRPAMRAIFKRFSASDTRVGSVRLQTLKL